MIDVSGLMLPLDWSGWRSAAALMHFGPLLRGVAPTQPQWRRMMWELEKYGPCYCEPPPPQLLPPVMETLDRQIASGQATLTGLAVLHGTQVLQRRGREALNFAVAAAARIAALEDQLDADLARLVWDVRFTSKGQMQIDDGPRGVNLGSDELDLYGTLDAILAPWPSVEEVEDQLRRLAALPPAPEGWSELHALAFLLTAGARVERDDDAPLTDEALAALTALLPEGTSLDALLAEADALYRGASPRDRFVLIRAVEDQLMIFGTADAELRSVVLHLLNSAVIAGGVTPWRRDLVTRALAVLALGKAADPRERVF